MGSLRMQGSAGWMCALLLVLAASLGPDRAIAGIDHLVPLDDSGIWARTNQQILENGVIGLEVAGALWLGNDNDVGHAFWQSIDSSVISGVAAFGLKRAFSRARPDQGGNPNLWFRGGCCESFPSGEVTLQASFVTPFIADFARRDPWIWALEILPAYDAVARVKVREHWQTDVIAGWALGSAVGYWTTTRRVPISVQILPRGLSVGFSKRF
ncbi:MAG TPA: phosphatase PAP2 family protein [Steroidobacteraceae bacterium]|nr:phosphatase PAP2 family protein [Steroidobacteraceae bacterium]